MYLYQSNKLDTLSQLLCTLLKTSPPPPLEPETIIVQHHGMAQWLQRHIAQENDIAANFNFPLPARFFGEMSKTFLQPESIKKNPGQQEMMWQIFFSLPELSTHKNFSEINRYLGHAEQEIKQYQLAQIISSLFDKYTVYRPDLLSSWVNGQEQHWQAELWRHLQTKYEYGEAPFSHFLNILQSHPPQPEKLPKRCIFFGINSMVPIFLELLNHLSRYMELHLFHLSPCQEYWGDISSDKELARKRKQKGLNEYSYTGNGLLSSWGTLGRDFLEQLLTYNVELHDCYAHSPATSLLTTVQNDILSLTQEQSTQDFLADQSLQLHSCHSPLREVQVLHDRLLHIFDNNPELTAGDILVTAPDINQYTGAIQSVFESAPKERQIPYHLADRPLVSETDMVQGFLDLLSLFTSRVTAPDLFSLLEINPLAVRFNLKQADIDRLQFLIEKTAIRWGLDAHHRQQLGFSKYTENTWESGLDQLMLGFMMGKTGEAFNGLYPFGEISGADEELLGGLCSLIQQLQIWLPQLNIPHNAEHWPRLFTELLLSFFDQDSDEIGFQLISETLLDWAEQVGTSQHTSLLTPKVAIQHITSLLTQQPSRQPFLTGRVTFCNMVPMRAVPFKMICILGMNDAAFPRSQQPVSFDLTIQNPRIGDRNRRNDDRYLFLEMLLSAEQNLYLSWTGQNQHDDSFQPPSIVLCELLEYLDKKSPSTSPLPSNQITTVHPLQPFSPIYFDPASPIQSYANEWLPSIKNTKPPNFLPELLEHEPANIFDIKTLTAFWRNPARYFFEQKIGIKLHGFTTTIQEHEPFSFDNLEEFFLRQDIIGATLNQQQETTLQRLVHSGMLPQNQFGEILLEETASFGSDIAQIITTLCTGPLDPVELDIQTASYQLTGWLGELYTGGRVTWRSSSIKGATLMELWIYHLALCTIQPHGVAPTSIHISKNQQYILLPVSEPEQYLKELIQFFEEGQCRPLHFFPESAYEYAKTTPEKQVNKAISTWLGSNWNKGPQGEYEDPVYQKLFPEGTAAPLNDEFISLSNLFTPILDHLEIDDAAS